MPVRIEQLKLHCFYRSHTTTKTLIHLLDQSIDLLLPIPQITPFDKMFELPRSEPPSGIRQLERPKKIARLLEIRPHGHDLMDQIFHADDPELAQVLLDDLIVGQGDALLVDFAVAALVDQVADGLDRRVSVGDVGFDDLEHFGGGFGDFYEDAVVNLEQTEELEDFSRLGSDFVDTVGGEKELVLAELKKVGKSTRA